jgi:flagellar biosynthesis protein FlhF
MRLKSYYAQSVDAAIRRARLELGEDAMLLEARPAPPEARHLGGHEVVFALPERQSETGGQQFAAPTHPPVGVDPAVQGAKATRGGSDARVDVEALAAAVTHSALLSASLGGATLSPDLVALYCALCASDFTAAMAREIVEHLVGGVVRDGVGRVDTQSSHKAIREFLSRQLRTEPVISRRHAERQSGPRAVAFVGPPGAGKTASLVKLATRWGMPTSRSMLLVSVDNYRIAGAEQLRHYAAILGVGFREIERPSALAGVLKDAEGMGWVWIDTPGFGPNDKEAMAEVAEALAANDCIDVHLVLPATMRSTDLAGVWDCYSCFRPNSLLVTRLDETSSFGGVWAAARCTRLPLSFLATGQRVPEDIQPASATELLERTMEGLLSLRATGVLVARATAG